MTSPAIPIRTLSVSPATAPRVAYTARLAQLSARSVTKHFDAYADIDWDAPDNAIDPEDPRWEKGDADVLGATDWYKRQPQGVRARIGLHHVVAQMKLGLDFEGVLSRGLLDFAQSLPNGAPEFRYAHHEIIEEGQHTLMFQEFVNRSGFPVHGLRGLDALGARFVPSLGRRFPELFFLFVLGGESPIDHVQREALRRGGLHPLLERVMHIHVTEEARHLCFAESYLLEHAPRLGRLRRLQLAVETPIILATMAGQMLKPPAQVVSTYGIPRSVVREAYHGPRHRAETLEKLSRVTALCHRLGIVKPTASLWRHLGLLPDESPPRVGPGTGAPRRRLPGGIVRLAPDACLRPLRLSA